MNRCNTCKHSTGNGGDGWSVCDGCIHDSELRDRYEPATNADHIRSMTDEELARMLWKTGRNYRAICADPVVDFEEHSAKLVEWLKQPYKEDT